MFFDNCIKSRGNSPQQANHFQNFFPNLPITADGKSQLINCQTTFGLFRIKTLVFVLTNLTSIPKKYNIY